MNSNTIINDNMTLEEKLEAINAAMNDKTLQEQFNKKNGRPLNTPLDPQDALMCEGCQ